MNQNTYTFTIHFYNGDSLVQEITTFDPLTAFIKLSKAINLSGCKELHLKVVKGQDSTASEASGSYNSHDKELSGALHVPISQEPR